LGLSPPIDPSGKAPEAKGLFGLDMKTRKATKMPGSGVYIRRAGHPMHASLKLNSRAKVFIARGKSLSPLDLQLNLFVRRKLD
jgi:hypothetical protein